MRHLLKALLSDNGSISSMRVMSLSCCSTAIMIAFIGLLKAQPDYMGLSGLCGTFLSMAMAGKVAQKHVELSNDKTIIDTK